jgi:hypothetical protein
VPTAKRTLRRLVAAFLGTSLLSLAMNGVGQMTSGGSTSASFIEAVLPFVTVILIPVALGAALLWYAVTGWARTPEPRWMRAIRWGSIGATVWALLGGIGVALWYAAVEGRDAGLAPMLAFLSSPIGFVIGAVASLVTREE